MSAAISIEHIARQALDIKQLHEKNGLMLSRDFFIEIHATHEMFRQIMVGGSAPMFIYLSEFGPTIAGFKVVEVDGKEQQFNIVVTYPGTIYYSRSEERLPVQNGLKVYLYVGTDRQMVACRTKAEAAKALGMSLHSFNQYATVTTTNLVDMAIAKSNPGKVFRRGAGDRAWRIDP